MHRTFNLHVREIERLLTPRELKLLLPMTNAADQTVVRGREEIIRIVRQESPRFLVVVGPCSIHDTQAALEYAQRLNTLRREIEDTMMVVMRVYFEKPRTTIGWKGLINDPRLDGSYDIQTGLKIARQLLLDINGMGLTTATEFLDPIIPNYIDDLISWAAIGARTTESQTHREMASGLSMPIGFKNGTDGSLQTAVDALASSMASHSFLGMDQDGVTSIVRTTGNPAGHVVLRGGRSKTNYDEASLKEAVMLLEKNKMTPVVLVDCSHANSGKQHSKQPSVWQSVINQRTAGNKQIMGAMLESNINEGSQPFPQPPADLAYGISITDACMSWETTEKLLREGAAKLRGNS